MAQRKSNSSKTSTQESTGANSKTAPAASSKATTRKASPAQKAPAASKKKLPAGKPVRAKAEGIGYRQAGVNIDEADRAVSSIRAMAQSTFSRAVLTDIGSFGGGYRLRGYRDPVLISSADGVGTKLKLAFLTGRHSTIGEDLVNHCVNDIAVQGASPLFFLDYFAVGKLDATHRGRSRLGDRARLPGQRLRAHRRRNG